ncbi:hypothetical protein PR048_026973 [Dryococelus australis]|uniref:Uncharacterized protein n=1 Tax=Dryococelus australis TaxID=614101 RepID=A0ABQ9GMU4_9NEOP|nr:hypothetical protein PR048_026973 [Dryococelus australis]
MKRGECGSAPEWKGGKKLELPEHRPPRFLQTEIRKRPRRESNPDRLGESLPECQSESLVQSGHSDQQGCLGEFSPTTMSSARHQPSYSKDLVTLRVTASSSSYWLGSSSIIFKQHAVMLARVFSPLPVGATNSLARHPGQPLIPSTQKFRVGSEMATTAQRITVEVHPQINYRLDVSQVSEEIWAVLYIKVLRADASKEIPDKTRRPAASNGTIPTCKYPGAPCRELKPGSSWWEASALAARRNEAAGAVKSNRQQTLKPWIVVHCRTAIFYKHHFQLTFRYWSRGFLKRHFPNEKPSRVSQWQTIYDSHSGRPVIDSCLLRSPEITARKCRGRSLGRAYLFYKVGNKTRFDVGELGIGKISAAKELGRKVQFPWRTSSDVSGQLASVPVFRQNEPCSTTGSSELPTRQSLGRSEGVDRRDVTRHVDRCSVHPGSDVTCASVFAHRTAHGKCRREKKLRRTTVRMTRGYDSGGVRLLASHQGEPSSIPSRFSPGLSQVGMVPDDVVGLRVFSGISRFLRPCIRTMLHSHIISLSSFLKTFAEELDGPRYNLFKIAAMQLHFPLPLSALCTCTLHTHTRPLGLVTHQFDGAASLPYLTCVLFPPSLFAMGLLEIADGTAGDCRSSIGGRHGLEGCQDGGLQRPLLMTMPGAMFQGLLCSGTPTKMVPINPIEHLWDKLDRQVRARQAWPKFIAQLMEWLQEEWRRIPVDVLQTLVESRPDRGPRHALCSSRLHFLLAKSFFEYHLTDSIDQRLLRDVGGHYHPPAETLL